MAVKAAPVAVILSVFVYTGVSSNSTRVTAHYMDMFPEKSRNLTEVSAFLAEQMGETNSCLMIGTFNGLSKPWANLLWLRSAGNVNGKLLPPEPYYPGPHRRKGLDPNFSLDYAPVLQKILEKEHYNSVIGISVDQDSPWWDADYKLWNAWKMNYVQLLAQQPGLYLETQRSFPEAGLSVLVYRADPSPVQYSSGWGEAESWGRWAVAGETEIILPPGSAGRTLHFDICPFASQRGTIKGAALLENEALIDWTIEGKPWQWQTFAVKIPNPSKPGNGPARIVFHFENQGQSSATDDRTLVAPFRNIHLVYP